MRVQENDGRCCGCTACANICPKNAITMQMDVKGFSYPEIAEEKCVKCGLCKSVCSFTGFTGASVSLHHTSYAARHKSEYEVKTSRSGGFFSALADYVTQNRGGYATVQY